MAGGWEVAAVLAPVILSFFAVLVTASPTAIAATHRWLRKFSSYIWPAQNQCRRVLWSDISEGQVMNQLSSLNSNDPAGINQTSEKPYQLELSKKYIQTDVQTLKAFLILTADSCHSCERIDIETSLRVKQFDSIVTIRLPGPTAKTEPTAASKFELDRMIEGYPPFYRSTFTTTDGIDLNHPIQNTNDMRRGAWVFAVGMSFSHDPVPSLHNMQQVTEEKVDASWKGTEVFRACKMVGDTLSRLKDLEGRKPWRHRHPGLLTDCPLKWTDHALDCYHMIMSGEYSLEDWDVKTRRIEESHLFEPLIGECPCNSTCLGNKPHAMTCRRGQHTRKDPSRELTKDQCLAALQIFNNYSHSEENLESIQDVLIEILQTAILGLSEVEHYFSHQGRKLELPRELRGKRYIYVRVGEDDED